MEQRKILLFIDATMREESVSRTARMCKSYLEAFQKVHPEYEIRRRTLRQENLSPCTIEDVEFRDTCVKQGNISCEELVLAREFASADYILIGAPYWDLSFPALLKIYFERVCIAGITFAYVEEGLKPLCTAKGVTYLTTCGGKIMPGLNLGADYVRELCKRMFGINHFQAESAELLDVIGFDTETELREACRRVEKLADFSIS